MKNEYKVYRNGVNLDITEWLEPDEYKEWYKLKHELECEEELDEEKKYCDNCGYIKPIDC